MAVKYSNIVRYVANAQWAILPSKMEELLSVLALRASGGRLTPEEIHARIGDPQPAIGSRSGSVAVLPLRGVIAHRMDSMQESSGGMSAERFTRMVQAAAADESVGTILIDGDTPGGTVTGVMEAADAVYAAREKKRVVAVANGMLASAGYWIASQAHEIVALPSIFDRFIGSIGVYTVHQDLSAALEADGVKVTIIKAGEHKVEGNPFEPLTDETRSKIQASVDATYAAFVKAVARGRGVSVADVKNGYGQGAALNAKDALAAGLIDRIATMDDTIGRLVGRKASGSLRAEDPAPALVVLNPEDQHEADYAQRLRLL
jgi:signal peptide peptidase SppA